MSYTYRTTCIAFCIVTQVIYIIILYAVVKAEDCYFHLSVLVVLCTSIYMFMALIQELKVPSDGSRAIAHLPISLYYHVLSVLSCL